MLDGAKDQALKIESSTAAVTELSASIQQVAENAIEATKVAREVQRRGHRAVDRMDQIRAPVEERGGESTSSARAASASATSSR